jgi:hypothetical protein
MHQDFPRLHQVSRQCAVLRLRPFCRQPADGITEKHGNQTWLGEPADLNQVASFFHGWLVVFRKTPLKNDGLKVSWEYGIPNIWKNKSHVPNHQPVMGF